MSLCERLSDRMPAVARGEGWTAEEQAHLGACADCAAEWELVRSAQALGTGVAADLNPQHVAERMLERLRSERAAARERWQGIAVAGLAAAAALVLAVWTRSPEAGRHPSVEVASANLSIPELDSLQVPELEVLLRTMDRAGDDSTVDLVPAPPGDLDDGEMEHVLDALEG